MSTPLVDLGTGITVVFGTSGFAPEITNAAMGGISRELVETSHLGTLPAGAGKVGSKTYLAGDLSDPGELTIEGHFNPDTIPPVEGSSEEITINFPPNSGVTTPAKWVFQGQMTSFDWTGPLEDKMTFTATIKAVGEITVTAGA